MVSSEDSCNFKACDGNEFNLHLLGKQISCEEKAITQVLKNTIQNKTHYGILEPEFKCNSCEQYESSKINVHHEPYKHSIHKMIKNLQYAISCGHIINCPESLTENILNVFETDFDQSYVKKCNENMSISDYEQEYAYYYDDDISVEDYRVVSGNVAKVHLGSKTSCLVNFSHFHDIFAITIL